MKVKYFIYILIICWLIKTVLAVFQEQVITYLIEELNFEPIELGLLAGIPNLLFYISLLGLLIKIARYKNKSDFLNS